MHKLLVGGVAVLSGLLFCCPKVQAVEGCYWPTAGFQEWENEIECKPTHELPSYILTEEDAELLLRVGVCEAGETDPEAIADVIQVVLNRTFSDKFPNTVYGVVYQTGQFSSKGKLAKANITPEAEEGLMLVINGENLDNEALYFESLPGKVWEKTHEYLFSYGGHDFYK